MGTKRLIFAIIVVILLIGGLIGGYYYLQNSSSQAAVLQEEMEALVKLDILNDDIDTKSKAFGNYGKVEESVKNDSGVRVPMKEVESRMKNRFKLAKTIAKASARS